MSYDESDNNRGLRPAPHLAESKYDEATNENDERLIVLFRNAESGIKQLSKTASLPILSDPREGGALGSVLDHSPREGILPLKSINVGIINADPDQIDFIKREAGKKKASSIALVVPDHRMWPASNRSPVHLIDYLRGYRDAVTHLTEVIAETAEPSPKLITAFEGKQKPYTWGLIATKVSQSRYTGRGVKVAILDTGFDKKHPDFRDRRSPPGVDTIFKSGSVNDDDGHGTHCAGIAVGPASPADSSVPRYGCAPEAELYACKVIYNDHRDDNQADGYAWLSQVLIGVNKAKIEQCRIINLSLGWPMKDGNPHAQNYYKLFEELSSEALKSSPGALIVAATGNEGARRPRLPAYCDSILAVGAIDEDRNLWDWSNRGHDILAPGVGIFSSFPQSKGGYSRCDGTSMAAAYVTGIAALWAEALDVRRAEPASAREIWDALMGSAVDGLVQAP